MLDAARRETRSTLLIKCDALVHQLHVFIIRPFRLEELVEIRTPSSGKHGFDICPCHFIYCVKNEPASGALEAIRLILLINKELPFLIARLKLFYELTLKNSIALTCGASLNFGIVC